MRRPPPPRSRASGDAGLTRRSVLGLLGAGAVAVVAGAGVLWKAGDDRGAGPGTTTTLAPPPDPLATGDARLAAIAVVGDRYRAAYPDDTDPAGALGLTPAEAADPAGLVGELGRRRNEIRAELADGGDAAVAVVDGWTIARTEARLAALISLA